MKRGFWLALTVLAAMGYAQDRTQVLVYGGDFTDLITLDPQVVYEFSGVMIADNLYETLVRFEGNDLSTLRPGLAERWRVERGKDDCPHLQPAQGKPLLHGAGGDGQGRGLQL